MHDERRNSFRGQQEPNLSVAKVIKTSEQRRKMDVMVSHQVSHYF